MKSYRDETIVQIIPANGWQAVFAGSDVWFTDVVCWALVEAGEEKFREVVAMVDRGGGITTVTNEEGFVGLKSASDSSEDIDSMVQGWRNRQLLIQKVTGLRNINANSR